MLEETIEEVAKEVSHAPAVPSVDRIARVVSRSAGRAVGREVTKALGDLFGGGRRGR